VAKKTLSVKSRAGLSRGFEVDANAANYRDQILEEKHTQLNVGDEQPSIFEDLGIK